MTSFITLLRRTAISESLNSPWDVYLFGSSHRELGAGSDVDIILVYKPGDEEMARRFRVTAYRRVWESFELQLDVTLLNREEEEAVGFVSREGATRILGNSGSRSI
ncbi:nucleotidyltransferase domain-containing protein [Streptomyces sp. NPDC006925]|uniref:nucleotidyltransferase domain-containing protein n=1 Tax=Streptomyces sp. NPDC006925 TaxID=3364768 RepID=UPI0036CE021D